MYVDTMKQCLDEIKALFVDWNTFDQSQGCGKGSQTPPQAA